MLHEKSIIMPYRIFVLIAIALCLFNCNNDDDNKKPPIDQLPPMTTTGENTIGCLVNGEPFTDSGLMNNFYQFVDGEFFLVINWEEGPNNNYKDGQLALSGIEVMENQMYILDKSSFIDGDYTGSGATFTSNSEDIFGQYETNMNYTGQIKFTKFDNTNNIMSGTFEFEAQEIITGETISITNGRFDLTFTN